MIPPTIRAVFFDAVGTVLHPEPGAVQVYAAAAKRFGLDADPATVLARFRNAFRREERTDAAAGLVTSEERERRRWQAIVSASLPGAPPECFEMLYDHFAKPEAWRTPDGMSEMLEALHDRSLILGLASNYDLRLRSVLTGRRELSRLIDRVVISSVVGVRKPGERFFAEVVRMAGCPADRIAFVGDDVENDYFGARAAGMHAVLLDPEDRRPEVRHRVRRLRELVAP